MKSAEIRLKDDMEFIIDLEKQKLEWFSEGLCVEDSQTGNELFIPYTSIIYMITKGKEKSK